jgi:hypothetical protein
MHVRYTPTGHSQKLDGTNSCPPNQTLPLLALLAYKKLRLSSKCSNYQILLQ